MQNDNINNDNCLNQAADISNIQNFNSFGKEENEIIENELRKENIGKDPSSTFDNKEQCN